MKKSIIKKIAVIAAAGALMAFMLAGCGAKEEVSAFSVTASDNFITIEATNAEAGTSETVDFVVTDGEKVTVEAHFDDTGIIMLTFPGGPEVTIGGNDSATFGVPAGEYELTITAVDPVTGTATVYIAE